MRRLNKFLRLPANKRKYLLISFFVLVLVRLGLSTIRYKRLSRMIPQAGDTAPAGLLDVLGWSVPKAAHFVWRASCLTQATAMQMILARRGYRTDLRIGMRRDDHGRIQAHAWLLSDDRVVLGGTESELATYSQFNNFSPFYQ